MTIEIKTFVSGQMENIVCVLYDTLTREAVIIDPSFESRAVLEFIEAEKLNVSAFWITHGHFDHFAGISYISSKLQHRPKVGLHKADLDLWKDGGGSKEFRIMIEIPDEPDFYFADSQTLKLGSHSIEVRLAPGHSSGSVVFWIPELSTAVCGDVIFYHGIGRTDLAGGSFSTLVRSIREQILTLPRETRLIPGHGPETTVDEEMCNNPFLDLK